MVSNLFIETKDYTIASFKEYGKIFVNNKSLASRIDILLRSVATAD